MLRSSGTRLDSCAWDQQFAGPAPSGHFREIKADSLLWQEDTATEIGQLCEAIPGVPGSGMHLPTPAEMTGSGVWREVKHWSKTRLVN